MRGQAVNSKKTNDDRHMFVHLYKYIAVSVVSQLHRYLSVVSVLCMSSSASFDSESSNSSSMSTSHFVNRYQFVYMQKLHTTKLCTYERTELLFFCFCVFRFALSYDIISISLSLSLSYLPWAIHIHNS